MQRIKPRAAADVLSRHLPDHYLGIRIYVQLSGLERDRILQCFHERGIFRDVIILVANPLRDAYRAIRAAADHHSNARRSRISQATAVDIRDKFGHHCDIRFCWQDALILFLRQDDYLIPFHRFAVDLRLVQFYVQKRNEFPVAVGKILPYSHLHFPLFTAWQQACAPKVCVDVFYFSVKVVPVDGRKGRHSKMSQSKVD